MRFAKKEVPEVNIKIPTAYWQYNLSTKLSFPAKTAYLICLAEEADSPGKPWWSASGNALADKYPGTRETIGQGLRELEKMNLLEIVRSTLAPGQPYAHREPNSYRLKPLYSPEDIKKQWEETRAKREVFVMPENTAANKADMPKYPGWAERMLKKNGFFEHTAQERSEKIQKALDQLDNSMADVKFEGSVADRIAR